MAVGGGAADSGENEAWGHADTEGQLLEGELHEAECMLIGEVQQIESLAQENKNKVEELRGLKEDVRTLQERNEYHVLMLQDEHASAQQELAYKLTVLREQATQLGLKNERYKIVARLNETAAAQVESLLLKMEQRTKTHGEEVHATRQEVLHLRQQLESTFRKTLKDLGGTYRRKAFEALAVEAKAGWKANKCLREEMALQEVGVIALGERHVDQTRKEGEFTGELKQLRRLKHDQKTTLADLRRETNSNSCYFADIQETKERLTAAETKLKRELEKQGVPSYSLREVREMAFKEKEECRRLNDVKLHWRRRTKEVMRAIIPSISDPSLDVPSLSSPSSIISAPTSASTLSSFGGASARKSRTGPLPVVDGTRQPRKLRGSESAPPGMDAFAATEPTSAARPSSEITLATPQPQKDAKATAGWRDRVGHVIARWSRADRVSSVETDSGSSMRSTPWPQRVGAINSPSSHPQEPHINDNNRQIVPPKPRIESPKADQAVTLSGSASMGHLAFRGVVDEDPWEKKRRMERAVRRRDAGLRAKGLAVNSSRSRSPRRH